MSDHLWYPEIPKALRSSSHLLLHYCAFHRVDESGQVLSNELRDAGYDPQIFRLDRSQLFAPAESTNLAIFVRMELLCDTPRALEMLRVNVNTWAAASGGRVIVLSRVPRSSFPTGDGSSLILDCQDVHLKESRLSDWITTEYMRQTGISLLPQVARCRGLAALLSDRQFDVDAVQLATFAEQIARDTIFELGPAYIAFMDEWVLQNNLQRVPVEDVPYWMQAELINSGVGTLDADQRYVALFEQALGEGWITGLRKASRLCVMAPRDWVGLSATLFEIERRARQVLSNALERSLGPKWARQVLSAEQARYIIANSGITRAAELVRLPNPLDYLTLGQVVDLAAAREEARLVGFTTDVLNDLRRMIAIRNRVVHMRLPHDGDFRLCRIVLRRIRDCLLSDG